jgi:uncharacterized membrane protein
MFDRNDIQITRSLKNFFNVKRVYMDMALDLKLILGLVLLMLIYLYMPIINESFVRFILGFFIMLFIPGYAMMSAILPGKDDMGEAERLLLSIVLSISIVPIIGFILNYTIWGIRFEPLFFCTMVLIVFSVFIANFRRHMLPPEKRYEGFIERILPVLRNSRKQLFKPSEKGIDRALSIFIVVSLLVLIATMGLMMLLPPVASGYTELYILGPGKTAQDYPDEFILGESKPVIVGISNHENRDQPYTLIVSLSSPDGSNGAVLHTEKVTVLNEQATEIGIVIKPDRTGAKMKLNFALYKGDDMTFPYRECYRWVNVV